MLGSRPGHAAAGLALLVATLCFQLPLAAETIQVSAPGVLDRPGATYVLTQDISAPGTAFIIGANGITLDLNGKTVTYNAASSAAAVSGVSLGSPSLWVNVTGLRITNGRIVQGAGASSYSHAVDLRYGNIAGVVIDNLNVAIQGPDCRGIKIAWGNGIEIHHNTVTSNITAITNRSAFDGYAIAMATDGPGSNVSIHDNQIAGGQGGIVVLTSTTVRVYGNDISHKALNTNGYGIAIVSYDLPPGISDVQVYQNNIHTDDGVGILVDQQYQNVEVYGNTISVKMGPKPEYGYSYVAWGIKCRTAPEVVNPFGLRVHDNTITATTGDGLVNEAAGIGIYDSHSNLHNEYFNNTINVTTTSASKYAVGIIEAGDPGVDGNPISDSDTRVYNNTITSNNYNIWLGFRDGIGQDGVRFTSNTLIKGANPINYHATRMGYWIYATENQVLLDTRTLNGADVDDVVSGAESGGGNYSLYVKWYLEVAVKDAAGNPIAGATVTATGQSATETVTATTQADGTARMELTEYYRYGTTYPMASNYTRSTPHGISISKAGYQTYTQQLTVDSSKALVVNLAGQTAVSLSKAVDKSQAAPGDIATYTITGTNTSQAQARNVVITDQVPANCTYVAGSAQLNGAPAVPDPFAGGTLTVAVGTLDPGASAVLTFRVTIN